MEPPRQPGVAAGRGQGETGAGTGGVWRERRGIAGNIKHIKGDRGEGSVCVTGRPRLFLYL